MTTQEAGQETGIVFETSEDGRRSTAAVGRAVVASALRRVDPAGAQQAERETNWRSGYLEHFRRMVEAGLVSRAAALKIAGDGLTGLRSRMRVAADGEEIRLDAWAAPHSAAPFGTEVVKGVTEPDRELVLPVRGERLRGDKIRRQLDAWVDRGVMEPSAREALTMVLENPEWLALPGRTVAVLGAGAEMGPLRALMRWGAQAAAVDLPRPQLWQRVLDGARGGSGTLLVPTHRRDGPLAARAGADLVSQAPDVGVWLASLEDAPVLGNYVYADGAANVLVSVAVDVLTTTLMERRHDVALAFLATPTDVFVVPGDAVEHSTRSYESRSRAARVLSRPLRTASAGQLLRRAYLPGTDPGIVDSLVPQQGPNYALAKRMQRWRAAVARDAGSVVSINVAPPTRTRSVVKNRALAAAYAGAHRFGVEVFEPSTSNVLMAALLVHDLHTGGGPREAHPWQHEAAGAVHGGLWRSAYAPRSALGLAALLGYGATRA